MHGPVVDCPNENGDVEAHNGHLKRRLEQHLLLRGYRDFASEAAYDEFVAGELTKANGPRAAKVAEELAVMRELPPTRLCEYNEVECATEKRLFPWHVRRARRKMSWPTK